MAINIIRKQKNLAEHHKPVYEIRIHARAGQGARTAAHILATAALDSGRNIQAFPEYGPERLGAPMKSYARISDSEIKTNEPVISPDAVVIMDSSLISKQNIEGLTKEGILIINSSETPEKISSTTGFAGKIFCIDATRISLKHTGKDKPNVPMLGALARATDIITIDRLGKQVEDVFLRKLGRPATDLAVKACNEAYHTIDASYNS